MSQRWPKSQACFSFHHSSAAFEKWRPGTPRSYFDWWRIMDAFFRTSAETTECWMACLNVTEEENCAAQSRCSESHARHFFRRNGLVLDHHVSIGAAISGQYYCALLHVWNKIFEVNNLNRKTSKTAVNDSSLRLNKNEYRTAVDIDGKSRVEQIV